MFSGIVLKNMQRSFPVVFSFSNRIFCPFACTGPLLELNSEFCAPLRKLSIARVRMGWCCSPAYKRTNFAPLKGMWHSSTFVTVNAVSGSRRNSLAPEEEAAKGVMLCAMTPGPEISNTTVL